MQFLAIVLFFIAAVLSAVLTPNNWTLLPLMTLSLARAVALLLALLFWLGSGRLDSWGSSRLLLALMVAVGAVALSGGCLFVQMVRDDNVPAPWPIVWRVIVGLLPALFLLGALLPSRKIFILASALAPVAGIVVMGSWNSLNAQYLASIPKSKEQIESDELRARRTADLDRVPDSAGPEFLVGFVNPDEPFDVITKAQSRIEAAPDWIPRLSALLDGENRVYTLFALTRRAKTLPEPENERCWSTAAAIARDQSERFKSGTLPKQLDGRMLIDSVIALGDLSEASRQKHCREIATVREFLVTSKVDVGPASLDTWFHQTHLRLIPEDAGIVPLLDYVDFWDVKEEALGRIAKIPDSTTQLMNMLDGPHRVGALIVLAARTDTLSQEMLAHCWQAAASLATEMSANIKVGKPPSQSEVHGFSKAVGCFWIKLTSDKKKRLSDLATMRDVVQAAGAEWDKTDFNWASEELAASHPPGASQPSPQFKQ